MRLIQGDPLKMIGEKLMRGSQSCATATHVTCNKDVNRTFVRIRASYDHVAERSKILDLLSGYALLTLRSNPVIWVFFCQDERYHFEQKVMRSRARIVHKSSFPEEQNKI